MARWTRRIVALMAPLAVGAALLSILGVIASDVDATPEKPGERATGLGVELRSLAGRSVRLGRSVQRGADWARPPLRELTDRAQAIEYDVRQLDSSESSRGELRRAALATAELAGVLARFQPDGADRA
jgi:hypothetical protein